MGEVTIVEEDKFKFGDSIDGTTFWVFGFGDGEG